jgi:hypothetical protein
VPVPPQLFLDDQLDVLQMRFGDIAEQWEGEVAPSMAPGLPPLGGRAGTRPRPSRSPAEEGRQPPRPSAALRTRTLKPTAKAKVKKYPGKRTPPTTTTTQEAAGRPPASLAIGARRRITSEPTIGVQHPIGASTAASSAASAGASSSTPPLRRSPARLPFAATTPVLRAHLGAKRYARIIGAGRLSAAEK